ncbi:hypothetical protein [Bauldia litoralis]|uniref:hypothetical protein n=1 Tax=Bauldia litoralis TaxID=665467 RepID=UPI001FCDEDBD|nr:hypothetical protein [Bauldia litoralis]
MLFLLTPGGFEELVLATSTPAVERRIPKDGDAMPDFEAIGAIEQRFGCELLGQ